MPNAEILRLERIIEGLKDGSQKTVIVGEDGTPVGVNPDGQLHVVMEGKADVNNSTDTALGIDEVFTGTATNILEFGAIAVLVNPDQDSATDGLQIQFSADNVNWHTGECYSILANATKFFTPPCQAKYYRIVYTNGGVAQTSFFIHATLKKQAIKWSSHRVQDNLNDEDDGTLNLSVLKLRTAQNTYVSGSATNSGNFKVSLEELESGISSNGNSQLNVTLFDEGGIPASVDDSTESLQTINYEHHEIHSGSHYFICDYQTALGNNDTIEFVITTPNTTKWGHMLFQFASTLGAELEIYEGSSNVVGGTAVTPNNNNRNSANTSVMTVLKDPTSITDGTRIAGYLAGANRTTGFNSRDKEIVLKQNTIYLFRFTSDANSNAISFCGEWYEHTDKN